MTAKQARELAEKHLAGPAIEPYMEMIHGRIKAAAESGRMSITHPFQGMRMKYPSQLEQDAIWNALTAQGYKVKHHPDPDPGDPRSSGYTEISWS